MSRVCEVPTCGRRHEAKGFCKMHYRRWQVAGDPLAMGVRGRPLQRGQCKVACCGRPEKAKGYCSTHYQRWSKHGDPLAIGSPGRRRKSGGEADRRAAARARRVAKRCPVCGAGLSPGRQKYCSNEHAVMAQSAAYQAARWRVGRTPVFCGLPGCAVLFSPRMPQQRCCCEDHGKRLWTLEHPEKIRQHSHDRRARLVAAFVESIDDRAVFERDRWRCHLCGKRVHRRRRAPHPMAATLDHVLPLSRGGLHERSNVRTAHFGCNSRKRDRCIVPEQLGLSFGPDGRTSPRSGATAPRPDNIVRNLRETPAVRSGPAVLGCEDCGAEYSTDRFLALRDHITMEHNRKVRDSERTPRSSEATA